jgi:hypothetical protein
MLERGEIPYSADTGRLRALKPGVRPTAFNMYHFSAQAECGTVCCIYGWAVAVGQLPDSDLIIKRFNNDGVSRLFDPACELVAIGRTDEIKPAQAAIALRNYLTHGEPRWAEALAE